MQDHRVAKIEQVKEGKGLFLRMGGEEIALFNVGGTFHAIGNVCPHQHFSLLHTGELNGFVVTCPMHGWSYDVRTGVSTNASGRVKSYEVITREGEIFIRRNGDPHSTD